MGRKKTARIRLTEARIRDIGAPTSGRTFLYDSAVAGLAVMVTSAGTKTFYLYKRMDGRPVRMRLGAWPGVSVESARTVAVKYLAELAAGHNPHEERRRARAEMTMGELWIHYLEGHAKTYKKSWKEDVAQWARYLTGWKNKPLSTIRRGDVAALHARIGRDHGVYAANRLLALIGIMFAHAGTLGFEKGNPARGVRRFKEQSRDRYLHADEVRTFFVALAAEEDPLWRDLFTVSLLTGARRANVLAMKWTDLALDRGLWRIPETESKNEEPLICILAPEVVGILRRRAASSAGEGEYVFPARYGTGKHVTQPKTAWKRIVTRAGLTDLRIHDLRRTLGSWQAAAGASLSVIGRSLGHKNTTTTAIYARLDMDPIRASVETATTAILAAANGEPKQLPAPEDSTDSRVDGTDEHRVRPEQQKGAPSAKPA